MDEASGTAEAHLQLSVCDALGGRGSRIEQFVEIRSNRSIQSIGNDAVEARGSIEIDAKVGDAVDLLRSFDHLLVRVNCLEIAGTKDGFWCEVSVGTGFSRSAYFESDRRSHSFLIPISLLCFGGALPITLSARLGQTAGSPDADYVLKISVAVCRQQVLFSSIAKNSIFVFSSARSGSTWLASDILCWDHIARPVDEPGYGMLFAPLLWDAERFFDLSECNFYIKSGLEYEMNIKQRNLPRKIAIFDRANAGLRGPAGLFNFAYQEHFCRMVRSSIIEHAIDMWGVSDYKRLVFKMPNESHAADFIAAAFPEAKIIHLVRDGRDVLSSRFGSFGSGILSTTKDLALRKHAVSFYSHFWNFQNDIIADACRRHEPARVLFLRYEDLRQDLPVWAARVYAWMEAPLANEQIQMLTRDVSLESAPPDEVGYGKRRGDGAIGRFIAVFSHEEVQLMNAIMGSSLRRYDYSVPDGA